MHDTETIPRLSAEISKISVAMVGHTITVDIRRCQNPAMRQIVLLNITRLQTSRGYGHGTKTRTVEVLVNGSETRYFRVPDQIDELIVKQNILNDRVLWHFLNA